MLAEYLHAYAVIMNAQKRRWLTEFHYMDAFAGPGVARSKDPEVVAYLAGSPQRAIDCQPAFDRLWFVDRNRSRVERLNSQIEAAEQQSRSTVRHGDANAEIREIVGELGRSERALAFLDPYGLQVDWQTVSYLAQTRKVDVFINFSLMDVTRNLRREGGPSIEFRQDLERVMLSTRWVDDLYVDQGELWGAGRRYRRAVTARQVADHYCDDLRTVFDYVSNYAIMTNTRGGPIYALVLASHNARAVAIMNDIIQKYQLLRE
jgi:three-Cys-motif partner protein